MTDMEDQLKRVAGLDASYEDAVKDFLSVNRRPGFHVGDLVTRDGTDVHRIVAHNGDDRYAPDIITVVCVKAPASGWCAIGEQEENLARRYEFAQAPIDVDFELIEPTIALGDRSNGRP